MQSMLAHIALYGSVSELLRDGFDLGVAECAWRARVHDSTVGSGERTRILSYQPGGFPSDTVSYLNLRRSALRFVGHYFLLFIGGRHLDLDTLCIEGYVSGAVLISNKETVRDRRRELDTTAPRY